MEDREIIRLFLERDESSIVETEAKYGSTIRHIAFNILGNEEEAQEVENDVYLRVWTSIPPHEPYDYFVSYLVKIARACAIDAARKNSAKKREVSISELTKEIEECISGPSSVEMEFDEILLNRAVSGFLRTQPLLKRNIFLRRYWYLDSIESIAEQYSISEGKVKNILYRTRNKLKDYLIREGYKL